MRVGASNEISVQIREKFVVIKCHSGLIDSENYLRNFAKNCYELSELGAHIIIVHDIAPISLDILEGNYSDRMMTQKFKAFLCASRIIAALNNFNLHAVSIFASNSEMVRAELTQKNPPDLLLENYIAIPKEINSEILLHLHQNSNIISIISPIGLFTNTEREILLDSNMTAARICEAVDGEYLILQEEEEISGDLEDFIYSQKIGATFSEESLIKAVTIALRSGSIQVKIVDYKNENNLINAIIPSVISF